jgi:hypothetical protein
MAEGVGHYREMVGGVERYCDELEDDLRIVLALIINAVTMIPYL